MNSKTTITEITANSSQNTLLQPNASQSQDTAAMLMTSSPYPPRASSISLLRWMAALMPCRCRMTRTTERRNTPTTTAQTPGASRKRTSNTMLTYSTRRSSSRTSIAAHAWNGTVRIGFPFPDFPSGVSSGFHCSCSLLPGCFHALCCSIAAGDEGCQLMPGEQAWREALLPCFAAGAVPMDDDPGMLAALDAHLSQSHLIGADGDSAAPATATALVDCPQHHAADGADQSPLVSSAAFQIGHVSPHKDIVVQEFAHPGSLHLHWIVPLRSTLFSVPVLQTGHLLS